MNCRFKSREWVHAELTKCPGKVELGSCCLYREESVGEPGEEGGVADKVVVYVISDRQRPGDDEE